MHPPIRTCMHACTHAYTHKCMHACMRACMHECMHACMHAYIHTYIHTYTHIYIYIYTRIYLYTHAYLTTVRCKSMALVTFFTNCAMLAPWHCIPTAMDTEDTMSPVKCHWHHAGVSWLITAHTKHPIAGHDMAIPAMLYNSLSVKSDVIVCGISTPCKAMHWAGVRNAP